MDIVRLESPNMLFLLLVLIPMIAFYLFKLKSGHATLRMSSIDGFLGVKRTIKYYFRHIPFTLRVVAVALLIVAMSRPQSAHDNQTITTEGVDIILVLDASSSMLARDFKPDRISAAKEMATKFVLDRRSDRLGLVVFAGESFTQSPLTTDHVSLINLLNQVESGIVTDGTAIGSGLATAVNRLKDSDAKSKVIILMTDGVNNSGQIAPLAAAEIARTMGVKVYTIGVGRNGTAPMPVVDAWGNPHFADMEVKIDEEMLRKISKETNGKYYRATSNKRLGDIYDQINSMEKTKIDVENHILYQDKFLIFAIAALLVLIAELLVKYLYLRQIP